MIEYKIFGLTTGLKIISALRSPVGKPEKNRPLTIQTKGNKTMDLSMNKINKNIVSIKSSSWSLKQRIKKLEDQQTERFAQHKERGLERQRIIEETEDTRFIEDLLIDDYQTRLQMYEDSLIDELPPEEVKRLYREEMEDNAFVDMVLNLGK